MELIEEKAVIVDGSTNFIIDVLNYDGLLQVHVWKIVDNKEAEKVHRMDDAKLFFCDPTYFSAVTFEPWPENKSKDVLRVTPDITKKHTIRLRKMSDEEKITIFLDSI